MNTREYMSAKIRELRLSKKLSQSDLGALLSTPKKGGTISSWEKGRTVPDENDLIDLCEILNVDISDFYPREKRKDASELSADECELVELYRSLPTKGKHAVLVGLRDFANGQ